VRARRHQFDRIGIQRECIAILPKGLDIQRERDDI
jgi:hypothetical protein